MQIEKLEINEMPKSGVIRILTAKGLDEKPLKEPYNITGTIKAPYEILSKRIGEITKNDCHVAFSYESCSIYLIINEDSHRMKTIEGQMIQTDVLKKLSINTSKRWSCFDLADFFRLNRSLFLDKATAMKLVSKLSNFSTNVEKQLDQSKDNRANYSLQKRQVVQSNLPESFKLNLPIFKGMANQEVNVEVDIDPNSLECILISPELAEIVDSFAVFAINEQLSKISELFPELPIIEV